MAVSIHNERRHTSRQVLEKEEQRKKTGHWKDAYVCESHPLHKQWSAKQRLCVRVEDDDTPWK